MDLKIKNASGQLKEISKIKETRKAIAQLKTILKEETKKKMTMFKVIAIEFKPNQYRIGEAQVNHNLAQGFEITKDFQTESGVVIVMTKWACKKESKKKSQNQIHLRRNQKKIKRRNRWTQKH